MWSVVCRRTSRCDRPGRHGGLSSYFVSPAGPAAELGRSAGVHRMQPVIAMAPTMSFIGHIIAMCLGFALTATLGSLGTGRSPTRTKVLRSLCIALGITSLGSLLGDSLGLIAFLGGAITGAMSVSRPADSKPASGHSQQIAIACLIVGPVIGLLMFGMLHFVENISPLDRLHYLLTFLMVGIIAGALGAGIVRFTQSRTS